VTGYYFLDHGSVGSARTSQFEDDYTTPPHLKAEQTVSMRPLPDDNPAVSLYLTRSEFSEVVLRANTNAEGLHFSGQLPTRQVANSVEDSKPEVQDDAVQEMVPDERLPPGYHDYDI
jgi:hypothetical protein